MATRPRRTTRAPDGTRPMRPSAPPPDPLDGAPVPIGGVPRRTPVTLEGTVVALEVLPRGGFPWLEVTVADESARVVVVFTGHRRLGGVEIGRRMRLHGVVREERQHLVVLNPAYRLLAD